MAAGLEETLELLDPWEQLRTIWVSVVNITVALWRLTFHFKLALITVILTSSAALALFGTRNVVKWPVVWILGGVVISELSAYVAVRLIVHGFEACFYTSRARRLRRAMEEETRYSEWIKLGEKLDVLKGLDRWRRDSSSDSRHNWSLIQHLAEQLHQYRTEGDPDHLLQVFSQCTRKNLGGIWREKLYSVSYTGRTKDAVHAFARELRESLEWLGNRGKEMPSEKLQYAVKFMTRVRKAYGNSGLFLSGGASNGNYHWGVVKALLDQRLLPKYISGTSAGAVVASLLGTRTDDELRVILSSGELSKRLTCFDDSCYECLKRYYCTGTLFSREKWVQKIEWFTNGPTTFREAWERTGRVIQINVSEAGEHGQPVMLNHDTTPDVVIYSAVIASAAMSIFVEPQQLLVKRSNGTLIPRHSKKVEQFVDGCFQRDLPVREMSEMYNIRFSIASQVNPHMVPFHFKGQGEAGNPSRWRRRTGGWRGGFLLSALEIMLKVDMRKNLLVLNRLGLVNRDNIGATGLFLQNFEGDITLVPPLRLIDYIKLISDPTAEDLNRYCNVGVRITWKKLPMLKLRMEIGRSVEQCLDTLEREARHRKLVTRRKISGTGIRFPSESKRAPQGAGR